MIFILVSEFLAETNRSHVSEIVQNMKNLGGKRLFILGGVFVSLMAALFFAMSTALAPTYTALYSELSPTSASRIVSSLEQAGFKVDISTDGSVVSVPREDVPRARMVLADIGLPADGMPGWELFDGSGMGMNTFLQKVNRLRALEGELARSIQTMDGIEAARVHLVLPEREAFSRSRPEPTASVIIRSRRGDAFSRRQGQAIRALIASAVPELSPQKVTVLSATGETLVSEETGGTPEIGLQSRKSEIEDRMARKIEGILNARVGLGNARVEVNVDLSSIRQVTRTESFDPNGQVVRSTESREQSSRDQQASASEVGVGTNLPSPFDGGSETDGGRVNETRSVDEIVNYEIANTRVETVSEPGQIERLSVAALVDGLYQTDADGNVTYTPRDEAELTRLAELIRAAIGFDAERGDAVSVDSLQFVEIVQDIDGPVESSMLGVLMESVPSILRGIFALALVGAVLALGLRPTLRMLLEAPASNAALLPDGEAGSPSIGNAESMQQIAAGPNGASQSAGQILPPGAVQDTETLKIAAVQGGVSRSKIESVGALVTARPDAATEAVRGWLANSPAG